MLGMENLCIQESKLLCTLTFEADVSDIFSTCSSFDYDFDKSTKKLKNVNKLTLFDFFINTIRSINNKYVTSN